MAKSNYDTTRDLMEPEFCKYDQQSMIRKFRLRNDEKYLYIGFLGECYRICRSTGRVEREQDGQHGDYNVSMSIFDLLCCSRDEPRLSGRFCTVNSLPRTVKGTTLGDSMFRKYAALFDRHPRALEKALLKLGGVPDPIGDIACKLYPFDCLPILFRFWHADEDFPASVTILWDENTLDFLHYETTYYVVGHLMRRLEEMITRPE